MELSANACLRPQICGPGWSLALAVPPVPPALPVFADQVPVIAALPVSLAGVAILAAAIPPVHAPRIGQGGVAAKTAAAIPAIYAGVALEAGRESGPLTRSHTKHGQRAPGGNLDHVAAIGLLSNGPGKLVEATGVHASLLL
jgi:hypothetical protein